MTSSTPTENLASASPIRTAAVVGSGIMGAQIAAHLASCGIAVWLLDLPAKEGDRNATSAKGKAGLRKIKPSPFYSEEALALIRPGNTEDHIEEAAKSDWIIEAIVEQPGPKQELFANLEKFMGPSSILATNTSGIPLRELGKNLGADVRKRFIGTHFFNPPRYLRLVEVIRGPETSDATVARISHVLDQVLGKTPVPAFDSPAFIANRIGVHAMVMTMQVTREMGLSIEAVDTLTGPLMGRPKTGTYRLADLVGLDTLVHIINGLHQAFPDEIFAVDNGLQHLIDNKWIGKKVGSGFYRKAAAGLESFDLDKLEYRPQEKARFEELKGVMKEDDLAKKLAKLFRTEGKGAEAAKRMLAESIAYAATVAPAITDNLAFVDEAMELGFGWEMGPFKILDAVGVEAFKAVADKYNIATPAWLLAPSEGSASVYHLDKGLRKVKQVSEGRAAKRAPAPPRGFNLKLHRESHKPVIASEDATLWDMGDEILLLEFHSKMNTQGAISLNMILKSVDKAASSARGLVIGNQGAHFCAGANIAMLLLDAAAGEYENIDAAVKLFQDASMAIKYAPVPVVVSPHNMALGGGCEFVLHSNRPVLAPETYMGLVEVGVGLLPAGGGTKELTIRAMDKSRGGIALNHLAKAFELIAMAKVSTSAREAFDMGLMDKRALIANNENTRLDQAKAEALALSRTGYRPPAPVRQVEVLGSEAMAAFTAALYLMREAGFASEHDERISLAVGRIMAGGGVSPGTVVDEQYLLDLEREEFLKLMGTKKTQERVEHMLKKGKPLRN